MLPKLTPAAVSYRRNGALLHLCTRPLRHLVAPSLQGGHAFFAGVELHQLGEFDGAKGGDVGHGKALPPAIQG